MANSVSLRNTNGWSSNSALKKPLVKLLFPPAILCPCTALSPTNLLATTEPIHPFFRPQKNCKDLPTIPLTQDTCHDYYIVILDATYIYIYIYMRTVNMCINVKINIRHMILHDIPMSLLQRDKNVQDFLWRNIQHMVLSGKPSINKYTKWFSSVNG